jgi:prefoldin alpha subunit
MEQQELLFKLQESHQRSKEIEEKMQVVDQQLVELEKFGMCLSDLKENKNKEILSSLGKGVFIKTDIKEDKLFVDVGSGVFVRKDFEETKNVISDQARRLHEMRLQFIAENDSINESLQRLIEEAEEVSE